MMTRWVGTSSSEFWTFLSRFCASGGGWERQQQDGEDSNQALHEYDSAPCYCKFVTNYLQQGNTTLTICVERLLSLQMSYRIVSF